MDTLTLKSLEEFSEYFYVRTNSENWRENEGFYQNLIGIVPSLLSLARRQLEHEGKAEGHSSTRSACAPSQGTDVLPLGDVKRNSFNGCEGIDFKDRFGSLGRLNGDETGILIQQMGSMMPHFSRKQVRSLIAHLQSWLDTGSFELKPRAVEGDHEDLQVSELIERAYFEGFDTGNSYNQLQDTDEAVMKEWSQSRARQSVYASSKTQISAPATDQSIEGKTDTERLDWLESVLCYAMVCIYPKQNMESLENDGNGWENGELRKSIDKAMAKEGGAA